METSPCACGCGREAEKNSDYYSEECRFSHNPNDAPYEKED
jgi:hypothetical protein